MNRDGDSVTFTLSHPEEGAAHVGQAAYDEYVEALEEDRGDLAEWIAGRVKSIKW